MQSEHAILQYMNSTSRQSIVSIVPLILTVFLLGIYSYSHAATFAVETIADTSDAHVGDGTCSDSTGACSLRAAIQEAIATPGNEPITIRFAIPSSGPHIIALGSPLPIISRTHITIDGTTQPNSSCGNLWGGVEPIWNIIIDLNDTGIVISGGNSTIKGLELHNANDIDIPLDFIDGDNNTAQCNYIHHTERAIRVGSESDNNIIGGSLPGEGNLMSYVRGEVIVVNKANDAVIQGNFIGTNAAGSGVTNNAIHPNDVQFGINVGKDLDVYPTGTLIGGTTPGAGNLINGFTGQAGFGIAVVSGDHTTIQGNYIGTDRFGTSSDSSLGNNAGIIIQPLSAASTIGGPSLSAKNIIGNSTLAGILILSSPGNNIQGNNIGTGADGIASIGNQYGILLIGSSTINNMIGSTTTGASNIIANNTAAGITLASDAGSGYGSTGRENSILGNSLYNNPIGIDISADPTKFTDGATLNDDGDIDMGPNSIQNTPLLRRAAGLRTQTRISGRIQSTPKETFRIEFFWSPTTTAGQGKIFLGHKNVTTNSAGTKSFTARLIPITGPGLITATATNSRGDTSELSAGVQPTMRINITASQEAVIEQQFLADENLD